MSLSAGPARSRGQRGGGGRVRTPQLQLAADKRILPCHRTAAPEIETITAPPHCSGATKPLTGCDACTSSTRFRRHTLKCRSALPERSALRLVDRCAGAGSPFAPGNSARAVRCSALHHGRGVPTPVRQKQVNVSGITTYPTTRTDSAAGLLQKGSTRPARCAEKATAGSRRR